MRDDKYTWHNGINIINVIAVENLSRTFRKEIPCLMNYYNEKYEY